MAAAFTSDVAAFAKAVVGRTTSAALDDKLIELKIAAAELAAEGASDAVSAGTRDLYESAALYSLFANDTAGFERHFALAKAAYEEDSSLSASELWITVRGLYLMTLLVQNRLGEFHAELELVAAAERKLPQIAFSISLDQYLAEGRYNKVLDAIRSLPHESFAVFVQPLVDAVRGEIAACSASSYTSLPVAAAQRMMLFDSEEELRRFVATSQPEWSIENGVISFNQKAAAAASVPAKELISNTLGYATELERIV